MLLKAAWERRTGLQELYTVTCRKSLPTPEKVSFVVPDLGGKPRTLEFLLKFPQLPEVLPMNRRCRNRTAQIDFQNTSVCNQQLEAQNEWLPIAHYCI